MQRFFFHVQFGEEAPDREGTEYPDHVDARTAAVRLLGEFLRDQGDAFWAKPNAAVTVTDAHGLALWKIETVGTEAAALSGTACG